MSERAPLRVCRIAGVWTVLDSGGGLLRPVPGGWIATGALRCCCWGCAVAVADEMRRAYQRVRGEAGQQQGTSTA